MRSRTSRSVKIRALIAAVCAIALLSGYALVSTQGRSRFDTLSVVFIVASGIALLILLHAIAIIAKRTMSGSYPQNMDQRRGDDTEPAE